MRDRGSAAAEQPQPLKSLTRRNRNRWQGKHKAVEPSTG